MPSDSELKFPPGPEKGSYFGPIRRDPLQYLTDCARNYGDVVGMRAFGHSTYILNHPDHIEDVLVQQAKKFTKGRALRANMRLFGNGLLTSEGNFWLRQRRLAQPAFHRARISSYAKWMVHHTERTLDTWREAQECDIHEEMMRLTLHIVAKTMFDADVARDAQDVGRALQVVLEFNSDLRRLVFTPAWLPTPKNIQNALAIRRLDKIIYRIIAERRASGRDAGDLLSMLLAARDEDGSSMTDRQLRDEVITLFVAGHETTALALSWTWWLLARHPEAEAKLQSEVDAVLGGRAPTMEDLPRLSYVERVVTEAMRLYPPALGMVRLAAEPTEVAGYPVSKGSGVAFSQWVVHRDARWYPEPEAFRPERWENDLMKRIPRFAYFPFGGGPRVCMGNTFAMMEAVLIVATVAQRFRMRLVVGHPVVPLPSITLRPRHGIRVILEKRALMARTSPEGGDGTPSVGRAGE